MLNLFHRHGGPILIHLYILRRKRPAPSHILDDNRGRLFPFFNWTAPLKLRQLPVVLLGLLTLWIGLNFCHLVKHVFDFLRVESHVTTDSLTLLSRRKFVWQLLLVTLWRLGGRLVRSSLLVFFCIFRVGRNILYFRQILRFVLREQFLHFGTVFGAFFLADLVAAHVVSVVDQQLLLLCSLLIVRFFFQVCPFREYHLP